MTLHNTRFLMTENILVLNDFFSLFLIHKNTLFHGILDFCYEFTFLIHKNTFVVV